MKGGSTNHNWEKLGLDFYRVFWSTTHQRRYSYQCEHHREVDFAGVLRFCKKWGIKPPPAP